MCASTSSDLFKRGKIEDGLVARKGKKLMINTRVLILLAIGVILGSGIIAMANTGTAGAGSNGSASDSSNCGACPNRHEGSANSKMSCPMKSDDASKGTESKDSKCPMNSTSKDSESKDSDQVQAQVYSCPMHPEMISTDPDAKCPECDMKLQAADLYACPMHPDQMSTDPDAKCKVCEMKMEPVKDQLYACSMDPDQVSTDPKAECKICGMKMEAFSISDQDKEDKVEPDSAEGSE
jgi:hypothetical protein